MTSEKQLRWDRHFLRLAAAHALMSKDPSTRVGAVIVGPDLEIRSVGFNGFPRGIDDLNPRLTHRPLKYKLTVHAELNAILAAARIGIPLKGCSLYVVAEPIDDNGREWWGGPPCVRCLVEIVQAGITSIIGQPKTFSGSRWEEDTGFAGLDVMIMCEGGITYREVDHGQSVPPDHNG